MGINELGSNWVLHFQAESAHPLEYFLATLSLLEYGCLHLRPEFPSKLRKDVT